MGACGSVQRPYIDRTPERTMLYCSCGFSCGVKAALDRHIAKFSKTDEAEMHCPAVGPPPLPARGTQSEPAIRITGLRSSDLKVKDFDDEDQSPVAFTRTQPLKDFCKDVARTPSLGSGTAVRIVFIRHAQSANKCRAPGQAASPDPGLTDLGHRQAEELGKRLENDFSSVDSRSVTFVSSPMRRCLFTIQPGIQRLQPPPEHVLVYGGGYEFSCAGTQNAGTPIQEIARDFPEFSPSGFNQNGTWDYRGDNPKETEAECRGRGVRIVNWLIEKAAAAAKRHMNSGQEGGGLAHTMVMCGHQTINDLLCTILIDGSDSKWNYGDVRYRLQNAGITEVFLAPDGRCRFGATNDGAHLLKLKR
eukprot:TRINITY_DN11764_c0_g1_i1.p1 TRINITY_DN11764_c0_g1~~TRINITY_DN11764_c0_g1_i1.p1  ORF type:complete len:361 (+),score=52.99 TRINITY_DN11764_c0_g1_i1:91-1173(+)